MFKQSISLEIDTPVHLFGIVQFVSLVVVDSLHQQFSFILQTLELGSITKIFSGLFMWLCAVYFSLLFNISTRIPRPFIVCCRCCCIHFMCVVTSSFVCLFGNSEFLNGERVSNFILSIQKPWHFHFCLFFSLKFFGRMFFFVEKFSILFIVYLYFYTYAWMPLFAFHIPDSGRLILNLGMKTHGIFFYLRRFLFIKFTLR